MPNKPLRACSFPGCPGRTAGRYCDRHAKQKETERRERHGTRSEMGYDYTWQLVRAMVLRREPWCRRCKAKGLWTLAKMVDHILPLSHGGARLLLDNLQPLCNPCHAEKTIEDIKTWEGGAKSLQV